MSTRAELLAEIAAQFPDNTSRSITPAKLRQVCENLANSATVPDTDGDALTAEIEAAAEAAASAEVSAHVAATDPHGDRAAAAADATTKANAAIAAAEATVAAALAAYTPPAQTVTASSITDAGTAGIAVLQAETQAQVRAAAGFGGTVTVAQLNAAGADARSAMYYCSDCLTVNGPGSLVAWCGRTLTWRTLDDCLLATTDFTAWANDFISNTNAAELRGTKGALFCAMTTDGYIHMATPSAGAAISVVGEVAGLSLRRRVSTGTNSAGFIRENTTLGSMIYNIAGQTKVFAGVRKQLFKNVSNLFGYRLGLAPALVVAALSAHEDAILLDISNSTGLNPGLSMNWVGCFRNASVNLPASGPTGTAPVVDTEYDMLVSRDGGSVKMLVNGVVVAQGENPGTSGTCMPFCITYNTATTDVRSYKLGFCSGYLLP